MSAVNVGFTISSVADLQKGCFTSKSVYPLKSKLRSAPDFELSITPIFATNEHTLRLCAASIGQ